MQTSLTFSNYVKKELCKYYIMATIVLVDEIPQIYSQKIDKNNQQEIKIKRQFRKQLYKQSG